MSKIDPPILPTVQGGRWGSERTGTLATDYEDQGVVTSVPFNQLVDALDQTIKMLNTSYTPEQLREEQERLAWFIGQ